MPAFTVKLGRPWIDADIEAFRGVDLDGNPIGLGDLISHIDRAGGAHEFTVHLTRTPNAAERQQGRDILNALTATATVVET